MRTTQINHCNKYILLRRNPNITSEWRAIAIFQTEATARAAFQVALKQNIGCGIYLEFALSEYKPVKCIAKSSTNIYNAMKIDKTLKRKSESLFQGFGLKERKAIHKNKTENKETENDTME